ncbi:hypothetical protein NPIL_94801 [Nephila pilipes]|uniref:Uncharacterized protein n=1 Tax=Nephila pilipes TaxID=299642 RepID=A0A8X6QEN2_NEPPI|nr:hypothetical protein NPIL_94801 [Nephila pilipes]
MAIGTLFEVQDQGSTDTDHNLKCRVPLSKKSSRVADGRCFDAAVRGTIEKSAIVSNRYFELGVLSERYNRWITFVPPPSEPSDYLSCFPPGRNMVLCTSQHVV